MVGTWQLLCSLNLISAVKLPSPLSVLSGLQDLIFLGMPPGHRLHSHMFYSLLRVAYGYAAAVAVALPLGILMGWSRFIRRTLEPIIESLRPIPPLAWIPIAILWFGIGIHSASFIIFLGAFFPILLNTAAGVDHINPLFIEAARTLNASRSDIIFKVLLPGAIPSIITGLRIGIGTSWMTLVAAEFTGVKAGYGLGYMIMTARDIQRSDEILAGMLVIGAIGLLIDHCIRWTEARWVKWR
jgi:ABC-type nitrate/sulfonate/bicarbonate transport system permease component